MRAVPRHVSALDIARFDASHLAVVVAGSVFGSPLPVIPLSNKTAPALNVQVDGSVACLERGLLVAVRRSCQHVYAIMLARRQIDYLPLGYDRVARSSLRGRQLELHIVKCNLRGQHFRWQGIATAVKSSL